MPIVSDSACTAQGRTDNIPPYVQELLDALDPAKQTSKGWRCHCPCPTHGGDGEDSNPSLDVSIGEEGKILLKCWAGCKPDDILKAVGLTFEHPFVPPGEEPMTALVTARSEPTDEERLFRNKVYRETLDQPKLHPRDREGLKKRGLSDEAIDRNGYVTLGWADTRKVASVLENRYDEEAANLLGLVRLKEEQSPRWYSDLPFNTVGLVIPCRDTAGRFVALKTRRDKDDPKYWLWTGKGKASPGTIIHVPRHDTKTNTSVVRVTEGELKADVATHLSGLFTISVPGVSSWGPAPDVLKKLHAGKVLVSFDWKDVKSKLQVCTQARKFMNELSRQGYEVGIETWDGEHKGVDDALNAGALTKKVWGQEAEALIDESFRNLGGKVAAIREGVDDPHRLARVCLDKLGRHQDGPALRYWNSRWYRWEGGGYTEWSESSLRATVTKMIREEFERAHLAEVQRAGEERAKGERAGRASPALPTVRKVTKSLTGDVEAALKSLRLVPDEVELGSWLGPQGTPTRRELLSVRNGILDVEAFLRGEDVPLLPHSPRLSSTVKLPFEYDPRSGCPTWLKILDRNLGGDAETIRVLQEWFGYCLVHDTSLQRFLVLVGDGATGKSVVLFVLASLLGKGNVSAVKLDSLCPAKHRFASKLVHGRKGSEAKRPGLKRVGLLVLVAGLGLTGYDLVLRSTGSGLSPWM